MSVDLPKSALDEIRKEIRSKLETYKELKTQIKKVVYFFTRNTKYLDYDELVFLLYQEMDNDYFHFMITIDDIDSKREEEKKRKENRKFLSKLHPPKVKKSKPFDKKAVRPKLAKRKNKNLD